MGGLLAATLGAWAYETTEGTGWVVDAAIEARDDFWLQGERSMALTLHLGTRRWHWPQVAVEPDMPRAGRIHISGEGKAEMSTDNEAPAPGPGFQAGPAQEPGALAAPPVQLHATTVASQGVPAAPRMPRIIEWLSVPEYPGFAARCWINPPRRLAAEIASGDEPRVRAVLKQIVIEHNAWSDDEGTPLPAAQDDAFWDQLGPHLTSRLMGAIAQRASQAPLAPLTRSS